MPTSVLDIPFKWFCRNRGFVYWPELAPPDGCHNFGMLKPMLGKGIIGAPGKWDSGQYLFMRNPEDFGKELRSYYQNLHNHLGLNWLRLQGGVGDCTQLSTVIHDFVPSPGSYRSQPFLGRDATLGDLRNLLFGPEIAADIFKRPFSMAEFAKLYEKITARFESDIQPNMLARDEIRIFAMFLVFPNPLDVHNGKAYFKPYIPQAPGVRATPGLGVKTAKI